MTLSSVLKNGLRGFQDRRRSSRDAGTAVTAFYWDGDVPLPHCIRDISLTGMYITTHERWYLGTLLHLTIDAKTARPTDSATGIPVESITVWAKVIRHGTDGVGFEFTVVKLKDRQKLAHLVDTARSLCEKHDA